MAEYDPLGSAAANADEGKRKLLEAVANAGTAGRKAYEDAASEQGRAQQEALARATQREQIGGFAGLGTGQGVADTFGRYGSALAGNRAAFESGLQGTQASGESYLEKVKAAGGLLGQINQGKIDARDKEIQAMIAQAQAEAEAAAAAEESKRQFQLMRDQANQDFQLQRDNIKYQNEASKGAAAKAPTLDQLLGVAAIQNQEQTAKASKQKGFFSPLARMKAKIGGTPQGLSTQAAQLGQALGVDSLTLAGLFAPNKQASVKGAVSKLNPQQKDIAADALSKRYAKINVTPQVAKDIMADKEFQDDMEWIMQGADGRTAEEVTALLRQNYLTGKKNKPRTYQILLDALNEHVQSATSMNSARKAREEL